MTWSADEAFINGLDFFSSAVQTVDAEPGGWQRPAPCSGWQVIDVLGHVGLATRFGTRLLRGEQPEWAAADRPGSAVDGDPARWWESLVPPAREAVGGADLGTVVDSPMGRRSIGEGLSFPAVDLFVHGWDLVRGVDAQIQIPDEAIAFAHATLDSMPAEMLRSERVFGPEVTPDPAASASDRFLAWTGRDPGRKR